MLFSDPARSYPNLVQALNSLGRRRVATAPVGWGAFWLLVGLVAAAVVAAGLLASPLMFGMTCIMAVPPLAVGLIAQGIRVRNTPPRPQGRADEATLVAQAMGLMLAKRRLHRDFDVASLTLLEECARHWGRARSALDAPFWTAGAVPEHYRHVRELALTALADSMDDVLLHYQTLVPAMVANRAATDYVEEALENLSGRRGAQVDFPPAAFKPVREIADRLRTLANETERMAQEVRVELDPRHAAPATAALDQTLAELRSIRQAEEELRQSAGL